MRGSCPITRASKRRPARGLALLGLLLVAGWLVPAGDQRSVVDDDAGTVLTRALQDAAIRERHPEGDAPFLRHVSWTDAGPDDVFEGRADSVSRRPRRAGMFTLSSYYEIVAVNVHLRLSRSDHAGRRGAAESTFQQLQRTRNALQTMTPDRVGAEPRPGLNLAQTFLSGVVVEGFSLEGPEGQRSGHLRSRFMTTAQDRDGWLLQDLSIQAANGDVLTITRAEWRTDGSLVATGPYTLERGGARHAGPWTCFVVQVDWPLKLRRAPASKAMNAACAPTTTNAERRPAVDPVFHRRGRDSSASWPIAILVQPLLLSLPASPLGVVAGIQSDLSSSAQQ